MKKEIKTYTPKELADMINAGQVSFGGLDFSVITGWDMDYFYHLFYNIIDDKKADFVENWAITKWRKAKGFYESYSNTSNLMEEYRRFIEDLHNVRIKVNERRIAEQDEKLLEEQMDKLFNRSRNTTVAPEFSDATSTTPKYHLDDLPDDVANIVILKTDEQYSCFVEDMRGPVTKWVNKHNLQDLNVVKLACIRLGIVARRITVKEFAKLLMHIIPGMKNQEENMKKRTDCNKIDLKDNSNNWKLKRELKELEGECFANTVLLLKEDVA